MRPRPTLQLAALVVLGLALPAGPGPAAAPSPGDPSTPARSAVARSVATQSAATRPVATRPADVEPAPRPSGTPPPTAEPAGAGILTVVVDGLGSDAGTVAFALYDSAESYAALEEPARKGRLPIDGRKCRWQVEDLPAGDYALSLYHDVDGDGELDKGSFGAPTEPYGFSNDARATFGPPGWDKARFHFDGADREVRVRVR